MMLPMNISRLPERCMCRRKRTPIGGALAKAVHRWVPVILRCFWLKRLEGFAEGDKISVPQSKRAMPCPSLFVVALMSKRGC